MTPGQGSAIGSLLIEERLAASAREELLVARQPGLGRRVLVRKLCRDALADALAVERFRREARMAARVSHPGVQQAFDLFAWRGDHYLVLEHVTGESLRTCLDEGGPPPRQVGLCIALEMARAVEALHAAGVIHADLRAHNVRIGRRGEVKITGLGWARGLAEGDVGAPEVTQYTAPEVAGGGRPDARSDAFALAALVSEVLSGAAPPARVRKPAPLARLLRRALAADPSRRPEVRQLREALERLVEDHSSAWTRPRIAAWRSPGGPRRSAQAPAPRRPHRARIAAGAALAGIAAALVVVLVRTDLAAPGPRPSPPAAPQAEPPSVDAGRPAVAAAPAPARLRFAVFPWAEVRIDGGPPIVTPSAAAAALDPGPHRVEFAHPTLGRAVREVTLAPGEERVLRHVFYQAASR